MYTFICGLVIVREFREFINFDLHRRNGFEMFLLNIHSNLVLNGFNKIFFVMAEFFLFLYSHRYSRVNILFLLRLRNQVFVFCEKRR